MHTHNSLCFPNAHIQYWQRLIKYTHTQPPLLPLLSSILRSKVNGQQHTSASTMFFTKCVILSMLLPLRFLYPSTHGTLLAHTHRQCLISPHSSLSYCVRSSIM